MSRGSGQMTGEKVPGLFLPPHSARVSLHSDLLHTCSPYASRPSITILFLYFLMFTSSLGEMGSAFPFDHFGTQSSHHFSDHVMEDTQS